MAALDVAFAHQHKWEKEIARYILPQSARARAGKRHWRKPASESTPASAVSTGMFEICQTSRDEGQVDGERFGFDCSRNLTGYNVEHPMRRRLLHKAPQPVIRDAHVYQNL